MFKVMRSGKRQKKQWKRMLTKVTFVGGGFTRKPPKYERFIRPTGDIAEATIRQLQMLFANPQLVHKVADKLQAAEVMTALPPPCIAGLRMNKAHVTHPELKCTFCLEIIGVKKNPNGQTYTSLGVITKGTIIEVNYFAGRTPNSFSRNRMLHAMVSASPPGLQQAALGCSCI